MIAGNTTLENASAYIAAGTVFFAAASIWVSNSSTSAKRWGAKTKWSGFDGDETVTRVGKDNQFGDSMEEKLVERGEENVERRGGACEG
mmetsp:Transcript_16675/g.43005  ORF Transcript_16675/g.43005 Transcript_16675/m.43005 type:complete len:89 (-) Transcript_16675:21-287(-)